MHEERTYLAVQKRDSRLLSVFGACVAVIERSWPTLRSGPVTNGCAILFMHSISRRDGGTGRRSGLKIGLSEIKSTINN